MLFGLRHVVVAKKRTQVRRFFKQLAFQPNCLRTSVAENEVKPPISATKEHEAVTISCTPKTKTYDISIQTKTKPISLQQKIEQDLLKLFKTHAIPIDVIEDESFVRILKNIPSFTVPSASKFTEILSQTCLDDQCKLKL
ncbi:unnamed protein product [Bursaphelenchus okinawaensis]|uniref:Uncharacterized protein n=1 Tax=Bursaphelenchus okinawaensis TaxID=465554 RepID=A0A811JQT6_9BILA|nr:unnamed protein product [Bursaphelenchus okinawaensis]CAG9079102.1 unnamed protein product [Bursaphelenchus okinawaensis]